MPTSAENAPVLKRKELTDWQEIRASESTCAIIARADPEDIGGVEQWEKIALSVIGSTAPQTSGKSIKLLFDATTYYESIGETRKSLRIAEWILSFANEHGDVALIRRAHNTLGAFYSRICDFKSSFSHIEKGYKLAINSAESSYILASLANAAATLYAAGLTAAARDLALKATHLPAAGPLANYIHLMNANNGIRFSHAAGDTAAADYFFKLSIDHFDQENEIINEVTKAYFEAFTAQHLILKGNSGEAIDRLKLALTKANGFGNVRVTALLTCALAGGYASIAESRQAFSYEKVLTALLPSTKSMPFHHEEVLCTLIKIMGMRQGSSFQNRRVRFSQDLREYILSTRHSQFFEAIARAYASNDPGVSSLRGPMESVPGWISDLTGEKLSNLHGSHEQIPERRLSKSDDNLRTPLYEIAEDWAVAAEFLTGGDWRRCFGVGELVRVMALNCQLSLHQATVAGLAARLCNIGKIANVPIEVANDDLILTGFAKSYRQAEVGEALLSGSSDVVMQLGSRMAKLHFEWWNGCGFPCGLRGEEILLEARICAVVDAFLSLVVPAPKGRWAISSAIQQLSCMAGVQLDPKLVDLLVRIVRTTDGGTREAWAAEADMGRNNLVRARRDLFDVLDLA